MKRSRAGWAQKMRDILEDSKAPKYIKGYIKQQINKGIPFSKIKLPPGYELAHFIGFEAAKGYDYRFTNLQLKSIHLMQHKFDRNGKKNKTPQNIKIKFGKNIRLFRSLSELYEFYNNWKSSINDSKVDTKTGNSSNKSGNKSNKTGNASNKTENASNKTGNSSNKTGKTTNKLEIIPENPPYRIGPKPGNAPYRIGPKPGNAPYRIDPKPGNAPYRIDPKPGNAPCRIDILQKVRKKCTR